ncbi:MAG: hypothetical protein RSA79_06220 [Oscillospiraceae bacterium]
MAQNNFFSYKGKPLVKKGKEIYYGSMSDEFVVKMTIQDTTKQGELELSNKILVQLMHTDTTINPLEIIAKSSDRIGISSALEIADIWLKKALSE